MKTKTRNELRHAIDDSIEVRRLRVASAPPTAQAGHIPLPSCFPVEAPRAAINIRNMLFLGELASSAVIVSGMLLNGDLGWMLLAPALVLVLVLLVEYKVIPMLKYPVLRDARINDLKAHVAKDLHAKAALQHEAKRWRWNDGVIFLIVLVLFLLKAGLLLSYGSVQGAIVFLLNWFVAFAGVGIHLHGLISRVACHYRARKLESRERSKRLSADARELWNTGSGELGDLVEARFPIECSEPLVTGQVDGHRLELDGSGQYALICKGIFDDGDRDSLIHHQKTLTAQQQLAKALVAVQIEMLSLNNLKAMHESSVHAAEPSTHALTATA
jgi:hypothetical protein